ncbi:MAG: hypothetical protein KDD69_09250 [Bdellovibrionales bacterium]|nr:hypothetical protein [Bdellovibrionales bacterium]
MQREDIVEETGLARATVAIALRALTEEGLIQPRGKRAGVRHRLVF